jgi:release factor glutamine methyltransferase
MDKLNVKKTSFMGLDFKGNENSFIPYKEAEFLVEIVIKLNPTSVLDIGTGIGNIAISIAKNIHDAKVMGTDISSKELAIARDNAKMNQVQDRVTFQKSDLLTTIQYSSEVFVSNLPFIPTERAKLLTMDNEPITNIDGGRDGFDLYRKLFVQMIQKNIYPKFLVAEIDYTQMVLSIQEVTKYFPKCKADILRDLKRKVTALLITF